MPPSVSVVIAARNEERLVGAAVASSFAAGVAEVIVVDGNSTDGTAAAARAAGATVLTCEPMRSRQFNEGARAAQGDWLIFLHGDTVLPPGAAEAIGRSNVAFGGFRLQFAEPGLRFVAFLINLRTRLTRTPWGDQAQFIRRDAFDGFREVPLMEDYEMAARMKRRGRTALLPLTVTTSGRRFLAVGLVRTAMLNWTIVLAWRFGVSEERLARWYRA